MRIVLLGAGHAHLEVIRRAEELRRVGARVTAVAPSDFWYSGLATSVLAGRLPEEMDRIDVASFCRRRGVEHVPAEAAGADPASREVRLRDGRAVPYDVLSVNVGSVTRAEVPGLEIHAVPAKPLDGLLAFGRELDAFPAPVCVVGGGATGCEVSLALRARLGGRWPVTLISASEPLARLGRCAQRRMRAALRDAGLRVVRGRVREVLPDRVVLEEGSPVPFGRLVNATGLVPDPVVADLGLPLGSSGRIRVSSELAVVGHPDVFAVGDAAAIEGAAHPPAGVFAVRQAPVLAENLAARASGRPRASFRLARPVLFVMALGRSEALAVFGAASWRGRLALRLKDRLDLRWLERYGAGRPPLPREAPGR